MPFNPALPVNRTKIVAAELRGQFTGLFDLIQTIPVGPQGLPGPAGVEAVAVDGVTIANPGASAQVTASLLAATLHFSFTIPRGDVGTQGATGNTGADGGIGPLGPVGPPFTSFVVDGVTTLDPALPATVTAVFDGTNVRLAFGIPRGQQWNEGAQGITGATGATGPAFTSFVVENVNTLPPGNQATVTTFFDGTNVRFTFGIPQGPQGFQGNNGFDGQTGAQGPTGPAFTSFAVDTVNTLPAGNPATVTTSFDGTTVRFTFGIPQGPEGPPGIQGLPGPSDLSGTSNNSNGVAALGLAVSDPPTQAQMQAIANKLDELINALRR
jgi:hypothetical protein